MELHEYQKNAVKFNLKHKKSALFLPMGAGKTAIGLTYISF